jgi:hypothetical protein
MSGEILAALIIWTVIVAVAFLIVGAAIYSRMVIRGGRR